MGGSCNDATTNTECAPSSEGQVGCVFGKGRSICSIQLRGDEGATPCVADTGEDEADDGPQAPPADVAPEGPEAPDA